MSVPREGQKTVCNIVERFRSVVKKQEQEQFLFVIQKGEYTLRERFKSLEIGESYFKMNERQKAAAVKWVSSAAF